jgi:simple sugar transport system permease protein
VSDLSARTVQRLLSERDLVALFAMGLAVLAVFSLVTDTFFTVISFQVMGFQVAEVALLSLAVMLSMLTGGIDLSIVSVASISALVVAKGFQATNAATAPSDRALWLTVGFIALGLVAGIGCGLMNAFLIAKLRITPILATLATLQILNGVGIAWTGGVTVYGMPNQFLNIGSGYVFHIPIPVLILLGAAVLTAIFVNRTGIGLRVRLVGANPVAARYSGLNPTRVLFATYVASALLASIAGVIIASRAASASADYGASYLLLAIVIVVLGGVSPLGGYGTVTGVVLSAWVLQMVSTGFNMVNFSTFAYLIAQGVILIGVIGLNTLTQRYGGNWRSRLLPSARRAAAAGDPSTARTR